MDFFALKSELINDPLGVGYATMTDEEAAISLNEESRTEIVPNTNANAKTILAILGASAGAAFLDAIENQTATNSAVKWVMSFIKSDSGIDVGNPETRDTLDQFVAAGILDAASVATIKALAERPISRAQELKLGFVGVGDVRDARSMT